MSDQLEFARDEMYIVTPVSSEIKEYPLHVEINMQEEEDANKEAVK